MRDPLTDEERSALATDHPEWEIRGDEMRRQYEFVDFKEAMAFVTKVALAAEAADHHPDIDIRWNKVALVLSTHSAGTLTGMDRALVEAIDGGDEGG